MIGSGLNLIGSETLDKETQLDKGRTEATQEIGRLQETIRINDARVQWLIVSFQEQARHQQGLVSHALKTVAQSRAGKGNDLQKEAKLIAIVVLTAISQLPQLKALVGSATVRERYDLVVVAYVDTTRLDVINVCKDAGVPLLAHDFSVVVEGNFLPPEQPIETFVDQRPPLTDSNLSDFDKAYMHEFAKIATELRRQRMVSTGALRILDRLDASLVVMFEDNAEYVTGIWAAMAQHISVPTVILPFTIADQLEAAEAHYNDPAYWADEGIHNRLARLIRPQWLYFHRDRWLLRREGIAALAAECLGVAPPLPWVLNSSRANAIAVESDAMLKHYSELGIPSSQLVMTGSVTDDAMYQATQRRDLLVEELKLDTDRPVLLCSFPPNQITSTRNESEFRDFHALAESWLGELCKLSWQVLIKPHPSMRSEDVEYLRHSGLRVVTEHETVALLPLCDLYNPSVSSTIRWALACGKPVLNYDVYRYHYQDFVSEPAVLTVSEGSKFAEALQTLTTNDQILREYTERAQSAMGRWGLVDGRGMERIVGLFDRLTAPRVARKIIQ